MDLIQTIEEQLDTGELGEEEIAELRRVRNLTSQFTLNYRFAVQEMTTKVDILRTEFEHLHEYSPIEHVTTRLKKPESVFRKMRKLGVPITVDSVRENVRDIAGVRVVCSFTPDAYRISEALQRQRDVKVLEVKDYIAHPKPNGYRSLHLIVEVPVFLSEETVSVPVEVQIRTIAMDFWASLEHKIYYSFETEIPEHLERGLLEAATTAASLDRQMEEIHREVKSLR